HVDLSYFTPSALPGHWRLSGPAHTGPIRQRVSSEKRSPWHGWELPVGTGYTKLSFRYRNDAEAVVVKKGCIFTGYDHAGSTDAQRGERVRIDGRNHNKPGNPWKDLDRDSLVDEISSVICECPATEEPSGNARIEEPSGNARVEERRKIDPRSNIPERKCPTISRTACAMLLMKKT
ncbi:Uncharacterized protein FKW44_022755, partial [Caligus rogercresseyi]